MNNFFRDSHKGFYCGICDGDSNQFVNMDTKKVTFSKKFCMDIVGNTLSPLLYLHGHFPSVSELFNTFISKCN